MTKDPTKKSSKDGNNQSSDGKDALPSCMRDLEQRILPVETRLTTIEASIAELNQSMSLFLQNFSKVHQFVNSPPQTEQGNTSNNHQLPLTHQPFQHFQPFQNLQHQNQDNSDGSDDERLVVQQWPTQNRFPNQFHGPMFKMKVHLPPFDGLLELEDLLHWIKKVENYFAYTKTPEDSKVSLVSFKFFEGASTWWDQVQTT